MMQIDWKKLRHEWKTFALAMGTLIVSTWDQVVGFGYDYTHLITEKYRAFAIPVLMFAFLALRRWTTETEKEDTDVGDNQ